MKHNSFINLYSLVCIVFLCTCFTSKAQITLTPSDMPQFGESFQVGLDNAPVVTPGSAGASINWNLSALHSTVVDTVLFAHVYATPYASYFPNSNICQISYDAGGASYVYLNSGPTALTSVGFVYPGFGIVFNNPLEELVALNLTYGNSWVSSYRAIQYYRSYQSGYDSSETIAHAIDSDKVDGWGSLTTPATVYANVLRVNTITTTVIDSFFFRSDTVPHRWYFEGTRLGGVKSQSFQWFANSVGVPVATLYIDTAGKMVSNGNYIFKTITGIQQVNNNAVAVVYPNPSNGVFQIQANSQQLMANSQIEVYNMLGEKIANSYWPSANNQMQIDLSNQAAGVYLYRVISEAGDLVSAGKLVIER